jgi:nucleoside-diphosphate-sugar epimerase
MYKLLVIGGSGFFGKSVLDAYIRKQLGRWGIDAVMILSRNASALRRSHPYLLNDSVSLIDADISTCDSLPFADYVIHAAASTDASKYLSHPITEQANALAATQNYATLAKEFHRNSKIVYASSGAVYGQQLPNEMALEEGRLLMPLASLPVTKRNYAAAKRDSEKIIQSLGRSGLDVSIARCFAFVGPYLPRDQHFAIGNFIADGIADRDIVIKASNRVYRSYMFADDLVQWLMTIAHSATASCPTYNVGSTEAVELRELGLLIAQYFKVSVRLPTTGFEESDRYIPSTDLAFRELDVSYNYDLWRSITETTRRIHEHI